MLHPLDFPIRTALATRQAGLAEIQGGARRYPFDIAPFASLDDESPQSWEQLLVLLGSNERAVLFTPQPVAPPPAFTLEMAATGEQMIGMPAPSTGIAPEIVRLGAGDVPAMRELVELTKPGPFGPRTHELGEFFGIRIDGRLAAMTGERMKPAQWTEMTAVCVHPEFRGRGYAQALLAFVSRRIQARGEIPFLHVFSDNASAIALYRRQGMSVRRRLHVTVVCRAGEEGMVPPH
ncbi:MAG: GNAT family N-acetyltransferase [Alphaproteobacteria bacterium]|nr:GNAT family N-acetyltransferase [Alphaproteobacteria bacterium]